MYALVSVMPDYPLRRLTADVAQSTIALVLSLPRNMVMMELGRQLLRAGLGVGANYRAAHRAQTDPDLLTKLKKVEEESDESMFWLEHLLMVGLDPMGVSGISCVRRSSHRRSGEPTLREYRELVHRRAPVNRPALPLRGDVAQR